MSTLIRQQCRGEKKIIETIESVQVRVIEPRYDGSQALAVFHAKERDRNGDKEFLILRMFITSQGESNARERNLVGFVPVTKPREDSSYRVEHRSLFMFEEWTVITTPDDLKDAG